MKKVVAVLSLPLLALCACTNEEPNPELVIPSIIVPGEGDTPDYNPEVTPEFSYVIEPYAGQAATDAVSYPTGNPDLNPEENSWENVVTVTYHGATAAVGGAEEAGVTAKVSGANVDLELGASKQVKIIATGSSDRGSLRLTGNYKHMLVLDNLTLTATDRPAINDQIKKRVFVVLKGKSSLADGAEYVVASEQRKGCFFAEDHIVLCGDGILQIQGNCRHGLVTDGFLFVNAGATLAVTDAAKNAIHVKGSGENNDYRGIEIVGGYVYANTSAPSGKAMKCDGAISLRGGVVLLNCSGDAAIDADDGTLSSAACMKSDTNVSLTGGNVSLCATGLGGKGISADGDILISGGRHIVAVSGNATSAQGDSSVPKGLNAHGNLKITAGGISVSAIGQGSTALGADVKMTVDGGVTYAFGAAYGVKAPVAAVNKGVFLCGGAKNNSVDGVTVLTYEKLPADELTTFTLPDGRLFGSFKWPLAMPEASLLTSLQTPEQ